jgi:hypothetical protein
MVEVAMTRKIRLSAISYTHSYLPLIQRVARKAERRLRAIMILIAPFLEYFLY